jgi:hypothetical protein
MIEILSPTKRFIKVLLPAFGLPMIDTKPALWGVSEGICASLVAEVIGNF